MKIAFASTGQDLNSQVDIRFARAPYFLIVDSETRNYEAIPNPYITGRGVGYAASELISNKGASAVVAGSFGPNAFAVLKQLGIKVYRATGVIHQIIDDIVNNRIPELTAPSGFGPGFGRGPGRGLGYGRGLRQGPRGGRGLGRGQGRGYGRGGW